MKNAINYYQHCLSFEKSFRMQTKSDPKFGHRGVVLVIPMPGKKSSGMLFWLANF
jgi:hypothetical protein